MTAARSGSTEVVKALLARRRERERRRNGTRSDGAHVGGRERPPARRRRSSKAARTSRPARARGRCGWSSAMITPRCSPPGADRHAFLPRGPATSNRRSSSRRRAPTSTTRRPTKHRAHLRRAQRSRRVCPDAARQGANPNTEGAGYRALHAAVLRGDLDLVKALLARGADPNAKVSRATPVNRDSKDYYVQHHLDRRHAVLAGGKVRRAGDHARAARGGADPRAPLPDGTTPLMAAAGVDNERLDRRERRRDPIDTR